MVQLVFGDRFDQFQALILRHVRFEIIFKEQNVILIVDPSKDFQAVGRYDRLHDFVESRRVEGVIHVGLDSGVWRLGHLGG